MVEVKTPDIKLTYDLLEKENLDRIGISRGDIREVQTIFAVPGYLYEEEGIAGRHHRLLGSACANFYTYDNRHFSIDDIWYYDENIKKNHFDFRIWALFPSYSEVAVRRGNLEVRQDASS